MKCVIIEDEIPAQKVLQHYISKLTDLTLEGSFQTALEANSLLRQQQIDVLFLDINLPEISGIQYVKTLVNPPCIIMTTAYHDHAVESFELDTICDYLVKPFSFERFLKAINKIKKTELIFQNQIVEDDAKETIFLNIDKSFYKIAIKDILYIASDRNYITIATAQKKYTYIDSLKNWLEKLPNDTFIQVHKSFLVNFKYVDKLSGNNAFIANEKIPVGRLFKASFLQKLKL